MFRVIFVQLKLLLPVIRRAHTPERDQVKHLSIQFVHYTTKEWHLGRFRRVVVYFQGLRNHTVNTKGDTKRPKCHSLFTTVRTLDQNLSRLFDRSSGAFNNPRTSVKKNKCTAPTSLSLEHPINHSRRIGNRRCSTRWAF